MNSIKKLLTATVFGALLLSRPAFASWGFIATIYETTCPATVPTPALPTITGFSSQTDCNTTRSQVLAIKSSFTWQTSGSSPVTKTCSVGYNCSACTGADAVVLSSSAGVFSPLSNGVTALTPLGSDTGQPTFSPHYSAASTIWQQEASARTQAFPSINSSVMPISSVQYQNRFAQNMNQYYGNSTTYSQPAEPARMSDDPSVTGALLPLFTEEPITGQSISGPGVTMGTPDTPPPPNPEHLNPGEKCRKGWWYNSATKNCYGGGYADCQGDDSAGPHRCYQP